MSTTTKTTPTPQQTASMFFGAGATSYAWWEITEAYGAFDVDEPDDWSVVMIAWHDVDNGEMAAQMTVTHDTIVVALDNIRRQGSDLGVSTTAWQEAALFLEAPDEADFDANSADEVLQVAVIGRVMFS